MKEKREQSAYDSVVFIGVETLDAFAKIRGSKRCRKGELQEMKKIADEYHRKGSLKVKTSIMILYHSA